MRLVLSRLCRGRQFVTVIRREYSAVTRLPKLASTEGLNTLPSVGGGYRQFRWWRSIIMPPILKNGDVKNELETLIKSNNVMVFSKTTCPFCLKVKSLFDSLGVTYEVLELDQQGNGGEIQDTLQSLSGQRTVPNVFIAGEHLGGADATLSAHSQNKLLPLINPPSYDFDLIVIGGGSGGLACAKEASELGKKVACLDFVTPSAQGTTWGLGGTCVNVGCIPKKLMHQAAILGHSLEDARHYGWKVEEGTQHDWMTMKDAIQDHIGSLNWNYRVQLRTKNVTYINSCGSLVDLHTVKAVNKRGKEEIKTAENIVICVGGRPKYPDIPGVREYAITSDDLFSLGYCPGRTLVVGASYVALECAGFLTGLGLDVTVMVRSILLRGFDQDMAERIGAYMQLHGTAFIRPCVPTKVEQLAAPAEGAPGRYRVTARMQDSDDEVTAEYDTIMYAVGRDPCTKDLNLSAAGIETDKSGFIVASDDERTSASNVYSVGDVTSGRPELTPVAIQAGRLLARRLYDGATQLCDYTNVPTTVFTPLEYGALGLSEDDAIQTYGADNIEVYHQNFMPLEWTVSKRENDQCYVKLICLKTENERVVGLHMLGPNAGEMTQGFTVGMKMGATKAQFDDCIGIHPTCAEVFTTLDVTKRSGDDAMPAGC